VASWRADPERVSGTWVVFRQAGAGFPPLWHQGSVRRPTSQPSARWHDTELGQHAQYFSLDPDGAWAELVRNAHLRTIEDLEPIRHRLWQCWVEEPDIADLSTFDTIAACGLEPEMFIGPHEPCRALANELLDAGYRGLLTPNAAIANIVNLTIFGPRREIYRNSVLAAAGNRNPRVYVMVNLIAEAGPPPGHILDLVRYGEDPHPGYENWRTEHT
jgi:hypothetical protein